MQQKRNLKPHTKGWKPSKSIYTAAFLMQQSRTMQTSKKMHGKNCTFFYFSLPKIILKVTQRSHLFLEVVFGDNLLKSHKPWTWPFSWPKMSVFGKRQNFLRSSEDTLFKRLWWSKFIRPREKEKKLSKTAISFNIIMPGLLAHLASPLWFINPLIVLSIIKLCI